MCKAIIAFWWYFPSSESEHVLNRLFRFSSVFCYFVCATIVTKLYVEVYNDTFSVLGVFRQNKTLTHNDYRQKPEHLNIVLKGLISLLLMLYSILLLKIQLQNSIPNSKD